MNLTARSGERNRQVLWITPPEQLPRVLLQSWPQRSWPWRITTVVSERRLPAPDPCFFANEMGGRSIEKTCFPDQSGRGLRMQGGGTRRDPLSTCRIFIISCMTCPRVRKVFLDVIRYAPTRESWMIPMQGLLFCALRICSLTHASVRASVDAVTDCKKCKFISSPSKSALYGDVQQRLRRNVFSGITTTRCAIMLFSRREGCLLNRTISPVCMYRRTRSPTWSFRMGFVRLAYRNAISAPVRPEMMLLAPFRTSGPRVTIACSFERFHWFTVSVNVRLSAMSTGTPISSGSMWLSPEMTLLDEKSTRFPCRLPRIRPLLPLSRPTSDFWVAMVRFRAGILVPVKSLLK